YTLTFENLAVASGQVTLDGWTRIDTSRNLTGNRARVFLFPPHIMPTRETQALRFTDVYLDNQGRFALPELLRDINSNGGTYRIGIRPLTVSSALARLYPEPVTLSTQNPPQLPALLLPNGDANRDGSIDVLDLGMLIASFDRCAGEAGYDGAADFNGDACVDVLDLDILVRNFDQTRDFDP
ncbi:MAG: dockerin type I domain-containing protein, partial [Chthonomonadaceae bacterium]|nr:dockerin type I domain-containing protein [Chthonomonadaceae bacterium]